MTDIATKPQQAPDTALDKGVFIIAGVVVLGSIMSILDITVVSVALQTFQKTFHATSAQVAWTMTGYTLALATVIPLTGWAADRFGTKRLYMAAIVLFALGSALCALADSLGMLVAFRVIQGLGGGMLMPLGMTILTRAAGPERVGRVMAILGIPMLLGPIFGPILGGALIDSASWHWIFLINVPLGLAALVYALLALPKDTESKSESFDFIGMILLSPGLAMLLFGISSIAGEQAAHGTWHTSKVIGFTGAGIVLIALFAFWALAKRNKHPLVDLRLFGNKNLTYAVLTLAVFCIAFFGASLLFPLYYQQVRGEDALHAGLLMAPQGIGAMLTMPLAGILADKTGPGKIVLGGIAVISAGMFMYSRLDATTDYWYLLLSLFVMGLGMGCTMMPVFSAAQATLREHTIARGTTLVNIVQQIGASTGSAIFAMLLTNALSSHHSVAVAGAVGDIDPKKDPAAFGKVLDKLGLTPEQFQAIVHHAPADMASAFSHIFTIAAILVLCCLVPAFFLPRKKSDNAVASAPMH